MRSGNGRRRTFLRRVGFLDERHPGRDTPYVAVRHGDHHVHLVVSRVRFDGTVARDSFDYHRSHQGARAVEAELGLVNAGERTGRGGRLAAVTIGERESAARRGSDPERAGLREAVGEARDASGGTRAGFEAGLGERGCSSGPMRARGPDVRLFVLPPRLGGSGR